MYFAGCNSSDGMKYVYSSSLFHLICLHQLCQAFFGFLSRDKLSQQNRLNVFVPYAEGGKNCFFFSLFSYTVCN